MKYRLYTTSHKAWDGMFQVMSGAVSSIYIEMYTFLDDTKKTHDFLTLLENKARSGVEVVVIADVYGSLSLRSAAVDRLRQAGVEFFYFSRWLRRTHRKILIIDNKIAFLGGVNIVEETRHWLDLQIELRGRIVIPVLRSFAYAYEMVGGKKDTILSRRRSSIVPRIKSWITDNLPGTRYKYRLNNYYRRSLISAKKSITIVTPYLLPPRWLIALLDGAAKRGVDVRIMIPNDTDIKILNKVNYLNACRLTEVGVRFYVLPIMNHAKIMLVDGEEGVIGSQNMDLLSFHWNIEVGVLFRQKKLVADLQKIIDQWQRASVDFSMANRKITIFDRVVMAIMKLFFPIF